MRQAQSDQIKRNEKKPWLDQTGNHYKIVTAMLIDTWNEHPTYKSISSMQITCMPNTQPMHYT